MSALALALSVGLATASPPTSLDNDLDEALQSAGLSRASARFDANLLRFFRESEFSTPLYEAINENPWRAPFLVGVLRSQLEDPAAKPSDRLSSMGRLMGLGSRRTLLGNPIQAAVDAAAKPGALGKVLEAMRLRGLLASPPPSTASVPEPVQKAAALVLQTALDTIASRRAAFRGVDLDAAFRQTASPGSSDEPEAVRRDLDLARQVDLKYLFSGSHDLTLAATTAAEWVGSVDPKLAYEFSAKTLWGKIVLSGGRDSRHAAEPALLIIDTGGDDEYLGAAANRSASNWLSVCIDSCGNDRYLSDAALRTASATTWSGRKKTAGYGPAAALYGVAVLVDLKGSDLYRSHRPGIGSATYGVAALVDAEGDDQYDGYINAEGYAYHGLGLLEDAKGNDRYTAMNQAQGHGGVRGFGLLLDREGSDAYVGDDATLDFPAPQTKDHNVSMMQGAAYGRRADYLDAHSLSGGIGALIDVQGDDSYSCGVFGQGIGYWEGVGILLDGSGSDQYFGQWYVQGASAHFAVGYLQDDLGNDSYRAMMNMAQGAGHDFGPGYLLDLAGDDRYEAPNLSLGAGNANGMGLLYEASGNDTYESKGLTLGKASESAKGSLRERALCLGVFVDLGGQDAYPSAATWASNAKSVANWTARREPASESQVGVFLDR